MTNPSLANQSERTSTTVADPVSFEAIFEQFYDQVYWYCFQFARDRDSAEDAASQVFENVLAALPRFHGDGGSLRSWLFRIAHNVSIDLIRKRNRHPHCDLDQVALVVDTRPTPDETYLAEERRRTVLDLLPLLPDGDRQVIALRLAGLDAGEICEVLGRSRSAVDSAQHRAVTQLKNLVGTDPAGKERIHAES